MSERTFLPPPISERLAWAKGELHLPDDAWRSSLRARFYEHLQASEFVPTESSVDAWNQLTAFVSGTADSGDRLPLAFAYSHPKALLAQVDEFAAGYFDLPIAERESRYRRLAVECQCWPAVQARLLKLRGGLKFVWPDAREDSEQTQQILGWMREIYVLPGPKGVARRQAILAQVESLDRDALSRACIRVRQNYGEVRRLVPGLIEAIEERMREAVTADDSGVTFVDSPASGHTSSYSTWTPPKPVLPQVTPVPYIPNYSPPASSGMNPTYLVSIIIFVAIFFARFAFHSSKTTPTNTPNFQVQPYSVPPYPGSDGSGPAAPDFDKILREINEKYGKDYPANPLLHPDDPLWRDLRRRPDSPFLPPPESAAPDESQPSSLPSETSTPGLLPRAQYPPTPTPLTPEDSTPNPLDPPAPESAIPSRTSNPSAP